MSKEQSVEELKKGYRECILLPEDIDTLIEKVAQHTEQRVISEIERKVETMGVVCDCESYEMGRAYEKGWYQLKHDIAKMLETKRNNLNIRKTWKK
jgi:hypothetical protein